MEELLASQTNFPFGNKKLTILHRGQEVEGEIVSITDKEVTLDLGAKSEGVIAVREIPQTILKDLKTGDKFKAFVYIPENEYGQTILSLQRQTVRTEGSRGHGRGGKSRGKFIDWSRFTQAQNQKTRLQGKVTEVNKGGLIVEVGEVRGFLPNSQVGFELLSKAGKGMEDLIGQDLTVSVIEVDRDNNKLIFSQRGQVSEEILKKLKEFKDGQKVEGKVVAVLPFGLVVDVSGTEGLVFISDVSWEKIDDLNNEFSAGQEFEVLVLGKDPELGRLNLSVKQLKEDPFAKIAEEYPVDEVVRGEIVSVDKNGIVVALKEGVEGVLPAAKIEQGTDYSVGKSMSFLVDSVDVQRRRINLAPFVTSTAGLIYK